MLSVEDHSGIVTFLLGIIVLVLVAVGLSIIVDKRLSFSSGVSAVQKEIAADASDLAEIRSMHDERATRLADASPKLTGASESYQSLQALAKNLERQKVALSGRKDELDKALASLEAEFTNYRALYRRKTWDRAVGERFETLVVAGGHEFRDVTITRVTPVGIEIRHEHGNARIQASDLDQRMRDRFQWTDEERRSELKKESENLRAAAGPAEDETSIASGEEAVSPKIGVLDRPRAPAKEVSIDDRREQIPALRTQVVAWRAKVARLHDEGQLASQQAGYGSSASVPGTLETWKSKAARLGRELAAAQGELSVAKARLMELSPSDPTLREPASGY